MQGPLAKLSARLKSRRATGRAGSQQDQASHEKWIKDTISIAADNRIWASDTTSVYFGIQELRRVTNCLFSFGQHEKSSENHQRAEELIHVHPQRHIAILATMHRMDQRVLEMRLRNTFQDASDSQTDILSNLRLVVEAGHLEGTAIDETEIQLATALSILSIAKIEDVSAQLSVISQTFKSTEPVFCVLNMSFITTILNHSCQKFAHYISTLLQDLNLQDAYYACQWLSGVHDPSRFTVVLDANCPEWRRWKTWRPNHTRLKLWARLKSRQREHLINFLCLEPLDIISNDAKLILLKSQLLHSGASSDFRIGSQVIHVPDGETACQVLDRILCILDTVIEHDPRSISVLSKLLSGRSMPLKERQILDAALSTKDSSITTSVLYVLNSALEDTPSASIMRLISALSSLCDDGNQLRQLGTPMILSSISKYVGSLQAEFQEYVQCSMGIESFGMHLAGCLYQIKNTHWLIPKLDESTQQVLRRLPPLDILEAALGLHDQLDADPKEQATGLAAQLKTYCLQQLTVQNNIDHQEKRFLEDLLHTRIHSHNFDHQTAALVLGRATHIDMETRHYCLLSLASVPEKLIDCVCELESTERACFRITRTITHLHDQRIGECWISLLESLIHSQGAELAQKMCASLTVKQWFQWQAGLREIFLANTGRQQLSTPLLRRSSLLWSGRLASDFMRELELIQEATTGPQLQSILLQDGDIVIIGELLQVLTLFQDKRSIPTFLIVSILSNLHSDFGNATAVTDALSRLSFMSLKGITMLQPLAESLKVGRRKNTSELIKGLQQTNGLMESDVRALKSIELVYKQNE